MKKYHKVGWVEYCGEQGAIVASGKTDGVLPVAEMSGANGAYGIGACEGLDGEITVFEGKPYVTRVRGDGSITDNSQDGMAIFGAWTKNRQWRDEPVPADVTTYADLQRFVKARATAAGIDTGSTPFPFLMTGTPAELKWHINVDRTGGKPLTRERFRQSKANYVTANEAVNIVGFYSEKHHGIFIGTFAPAMKGEDVKNAMHIHLISKDGTSAGHIDDLTLDGGMTLRLPKLSSRREMNRAPLPGMLPRVALTAPRSRRLTQRLGCRTDSPARARSAGSSSRCVDVHPRRVG